MTGLPAALVVVAGGIAALLPYRLGNLVPDLPPGPPPDRLR